MTPAPITPRDWLALAVLGLVGHAGYQYFFIGGLARTSVANSSLMLAATPVVIALITAALGQDRIGRLHWVGAVLSMAGIYLVVGHGPQGGGASLAGDAMMFVGVIAGRSTRSARGSSCCAIPRSASPVCRWRSAPSSTCRW